MKLRRAFATCMLGVFFTYGGCSGEEKRPGSVDDENVRRDGGRRAQGSEDGGTSSGDASGGGPTGKEGGIALDGGLPDAQGEPEPVANCGPGGSCIGNQKCTTDDDQQFCECDEGYFPDPAAPELTCVLDESCMRVRYLNHGCRHQYGNLPAVATFFGVEYCAGIPVPRSKLPADLSDAFVLLEDEVIPDPDESGVFIEPRDVESFVTLAIDVSESVATDPARFSALVAELRDFVGQLDMNPPVTFSILIFGGTLHEYLEPTRDLTRVSAALTRLDDDGVVTERVDIGGTGLNAAVNHGIDMTERLLVLRDQVTDSGVLADGTLVVLTDGADTGGDQLDTGHIKETPVHLVSIGISDNIDDGSLTEIGRDGSFLAPTREHWASTLASVADGIRGRGDSVYHIGFCSPKQYGTGNHELSIGVAGAEEGSETSCRFSADNFGSGTMAACRTRIAAPCSGQGECGGFFACGSTCSDGQCCNDAGQCVSPAPHPDDCRAQDALCHVPGALRQKECVEVDDDVFQCVDPALVGDRCSVESPCESGAALCVEVPIDGGTADTCTTEGMLSEGDLCSLDADEPALQCETMRCARVAADEYRCLRPARMFDRCSGSDDAAVCEPGTTCKSSICTPRQEFACTSDTDCLSGHCLDRICVGSLACHMSWAATLTGDGQTF